MIFLAKLHAYLKVDSRHICFANDPLAQLALTELANWNCPWQNSLASHVSVWFFIKADTGF